MGHEWPEGRSDGRAQAQPHGHRREERRTAAEEEADGHGGEPGVGVRMDAEAHADRAAAVKSVLRMRRPENSVAQNRMLSIIQMDMLKLPAADVVPVVRGWWEKEPSSYWRWTSSGAVAVTRTTYRCGLCGRGTAVKSNYCPNCGAKMDGGDSDAAD